MPDPILIVGAGPVGLAAAVELARRNQAVRILERLGERSWHSKALGINSRSLELMEAADVTERLEAAGRPCPGMEFWHDDKRLARLNVDEIGAKHGHILILAQSETERILEMRLRELGVTVDRNCTLTRFEQDKAGVTAHWESPDGEQSGRFAWLIGADGSRSTVRNALNIDFVGARMKDTWELIDAHMDTPWDNDPITIRFTSGKPLLFLLRLHDDLFRLASNTPGIIHRLPESCLVHRVVWQSEFHVAHRQAARYQVGRVFLIGDAAHIHSPIGGRGMNMGIEDACLLTAKLAEGDPGNWAARRHKNTRAAVKMIHWQTWMATSQSFPARFMRRYGMPQALKIRAIRRAFMRRAQGFGYSL